MRRYNAETAPAVTCSSRPATLNWKVKDSDGQPSNYGHAFPQASSDTQDPGAHVIRTVGSDKRGNVDTCHISAEKLEISCPRPQEFIRYFVGSH